MDSVDRHDEPPSRMPVKIGTEPRPCVPNHARESRPAGCRRARRRRPANRSGSQRDHAGSVAWLILTSTTVRCGASGSFAGWQDSAPRHVAPAGISLPGSSPARGRRAAGAGLDRWASHPLARRDDSGRLDCRRAVPSAAGVQELPPGGPVGGGGLDSDRVADGRLSEERWVWLWACLSRCSSWRAGLVALRVFRRRSLGDVTGHSRLGGDRSRRGASVEKRSPVLACEMVGVGLRPARATRVLLRGLDIHRDPTPPTLIEPDHAEHAARHVSEQNREPDVDRVERAGLLDDETDARAAPRSARRSRCRAGSACRPCPGARRCR